MTQTKKNPDSMVRLTLVLLVISALTSLLLGLVNYITEDRIDEILTEKTDSAMREVMPGAGQFVELEDVDTSGTVVDAVFSAEGQGYVVRVSPSGFGGSIDMVVGIDMSGAVTGISIIDMSETSGLGANASKESYRVQYIGSSGSVSLKNQGGTVDALTGATITSQAVTDGVNAALDIISSAAATPDGLS